MSTATPCDVKSLQAEVRPPRKDGLQITWRCAQQYSYTIVTAARSVWC